MGTIVFVRNCYYFAKMDFFWLGPIYKLFKSHVNDALMWILRILGPIKFCKVPIFFRKMSIKIWKLHVLDWDIGHCPILRAHYYYFGPGLSLMMTSL